MIFSPYTKQLHNTKVAVFVETKALSDHFAQIMLTPQQYRSLLLILETMMENDSVMRTFQVRTSNLHEYDFPNIQEVYTPMPKI